MPRKTVSERFWSKVDKSGSCWLWLAGKGSHGYGMFDAGYGMTCAHRVAYELVIGDIPAGLELDHLCRNRVCVNPSHLEPVTSQENTRRGDAGKNNAVKTHCPAGHEYNQANTYVYKNRRNCRRCRNPAVRKGRVRVWSLSVPASL
jgi:hypothetical protein